jgi:4-hydroxybenzoate polyprenyltransferase
MRATPDASVAGSVSLGAARSWALFASVGRLHILAIAALGTLTFGWIFTGRHPWLAAGLCALDWFVVNLLNRVVDLEEDRANGIRGTNFVGRHRRALVTGGFSLLFVALAGGHLCAPTLTPWRASYHALGLAYNWPLLPGRRRIKQLYFWKNIASATGFLVTVFGYPLAIASSTSALAPGVSAVTIALAAAFFLPFELSYEVIYDLRDARGDALAGVRSYPVVHGVVGATRIVDGLLAASLTALAAGYATGVLPWRIAIMAIAPVVQLVLYKRWMRRPGGIRARDCVRLTWLGAALLVTYHLWVALELPGAGT